LDKALEVIMVAMILVVAAVVILAMLQGRTGDFSGFTQDQVNSSDCGLGELKYERNLDCDAGTPDTGTAQNIEDSNSPKCDWAEDNPTGSSYCP
jgi:hypothetical protein